MWILSAYYFFYSLFVWLDLQVKSVFYPRLIGISLKESANLGLLPGTLSKNYIINSFNFLLKTIGNGFGNLFTIL